jgi:hypothetical protein
VLKGCVPPRASRPWRRRVAAVVEVGAEEGRAQKRSDQSVLWSAGYGSTSRSCPIICVIPMRLITSDYFGMQPMKCVDGLSKVDGVNLSVRFVASSDNWRICVDSNDIQAFRVSIHTLREVSDQLFRHLEVLGVAEVEISDDYYWDVPDPERYQPYRNPNELVIGQLTEDWDALQALHAGTEPIAYDLVRLAALLRRVGEMTMG